MKDLIYYLKKYGNTSFSELPFNEMDTIFLNQLTYCNLSFLDANPEEPFYLSHICDSEDYNSLTLKSTTQMNNKKMLPVFKKTTRYNDVYFKYITNVLDEKTQFFVVTYFLDDFAYISFRGTDTTVSGWKEDTEMLFKDIIPSQAYALLYVDTVCGWIDKPVVIGGHSKGGNLAIYSATFTKYQDKILWIDDLDGPGFNSEYIYNTDEYKLILPKLRCFSAYYSVVAMLMYHPNDVTFIFSTGLGVLQHDMYSWSFDEKNMRLKRIKNSAVDSNTVNIAVKRFLSTTTEEERKLFVDTFFFMVADKETDDLFDIVKNPFIYMNNVNKRKKLLAPGVYKDYTKVIKKLQKSFDYANRENFKQVVLKRPISK